VKAHVAIGPRAAKDFRGLDAIARKRVRAVLADRLSTVPLPGNLDLKPLEGLRPWLRVRVGEHRIICRQLTPAQLRETGSSLGYYVARIIDRKQLLAAAKNL